MLVNELVARYKKNEPGKRQVMQQIWYDKFVLIGEKRWPLARYLVKRVEKELALELHNGHDKVMYNNHRMLEKAAEQLKPYWVTDGKKKAKIQRQNAVWKKPCRPL